MSSTRNTAPAVRSLEELGGRSSDFWADVPSNQATEPTRGASGPPSAPPSVSDPLHKVKRLLRGRWPLLVVLALGGGMAGAVVGYSTTAPTYRSSGRITIQPNVPGFDDSKQRFADGYVGFMRNERDRIAVLPAAASEAVMTDTWQALQMDWSPELFASFVTARRLDGTLHIDVTFTHRSPKIAEVGLAATLQGYDRDIGRRRQATDRTLDQGRQQTLDTYQQELRQVNENIRQLSLGYDGSENLSDLHARKTAVLNQSALQLDRLEQDLRRGHHLRETAARLTPEELALGDRGLALLLNERALIRAEVMRVRRTVGERANVMRNLQGDLDLVEAQITERAEEARQVFFGSMPNLADGGGDRVSVTRDYLEQLNVRIENLRPQVESLAEELTLVVNDREELANLVRRRAELRGQIQSVEDTIRERRRNELVERGLQESDVSYIEYQPPLGRSSKARVDQDPRRKTALGGAIIGAGLPVGLLLLIGLFDKRTRYSDDAVDLAAEMPYANDRPVPMLGVLPDLPDRLSDPNQASIAAHCVHQIRTILQIHHAVPGGGDDSSEAPRAFAITSGGREDGKTSLALALGLSYAASGCRTLLVDTDLRGGGLSKRLKVTGDEGVLDALTGGDLLEVTCETEVADLAILPIGKASQAKAGIFSPQAVRRLVREAKRHFDVILLDCGPVLGSIETTPVASAADATIVVVSRNQSQVAVRKAGKHLEGVGATLAGLVFNRAGSADFDRSVAGMNYRSASRGRADA